MPGAAEPVRSFELSQPVGTGSTASSGALARALQPSDRRISPSGRARQTVPPRRRQLAVALLAR